MQGEKGGTAELPALWLGCAVFVFGCIMPPEIARIALPNVWRDTNHAGIQNGQGVFAAGCGGTHL